MMDGKEHHYCGRGPAISSFIIHSSQTLHFQPVSALSAARNLRNLLCESRREKSLAHSDKHLFKSTFVLLKSPGQLLLVVMGTDIHTSF